MTHFKYPRRANQHYGHDVTIKVVRRTHNGEQVPYVHVSVTAPNGSRGTLLLDSSEARMLAIELRDMASDVEP